MVVGFALYFQMAEYSAQCDFQQQDCLVKCLEEERETSKVSVYNLKRFYFRNSSFAVVDRTLVLLPLSYYRVTIEKILAASPAGIFKVDKTKKVGRGE